MKPILREEVLRWMSWKDRWEGEAHWEEENEWKPTLQHERWDSGEQRNLCRPCFSLNTATSAIAFQSQSKSIRFNALSNQPYPQNSLHSLFPIHYITSIHSSSSSFHINIFSFSKCHAIIWFSVKKILFTFITVSSVKRKEKQYAY